MDWVKHVTLRNQRSQIYSVDLHPDGTRFATGAGDSKVSVLPKRRPQYARFQLDSLF